MSSTAPPVQTAARKARKSSSIPAQTSSAPINQRMRSVATTSL